MQSAFEQDIQADKKTSISDEVKPNSGILNISDSLEETKNDTLELADKSNEEEQSEDDQIQALLKDMSPKSKQQLISDVEAHGGETNYLLSVIIFNNVLSQEKLTSFYSDRKMAYRAVIDKINVQRSRTNIMDWLVVVTSNLHISDEAFFHGIHLAESALTHFHLKQ